MRAFNRVYPGFYVRTLCLTYCAILLCLPCFTGDDGGDIGGTAALRPRTNIKPKKKAIDLRKNDIWIGYSQYGGAAVPGGAWSPLHLRITNNSKKIFESVLHYTLSEKRASQTYLTEYRSRLVLAGRGSKKHITTHLYIPQELYGHGPLEGNPYNLGLSFEGQTHFLLDRSVPVNGVLELNQDLSVGLERRDRTRRLFLILSPGTITPAINRDLVITKNQLAQWRAIRCDKRSLARRWIGYEGLSAIVWDGMDVSGVDPVPALALRNYVAAGGHLIIAVGENRNAVSRSFLNGLLPCTLGQLSDKDLGRSLLKLQSEKQASVCSLVPSEGSQVLAINDADGTPCWTDANTASPLAVRASYGTGTVTVLAFSLQSSFLRFSIQDNAEQQAKLRWHQFSRPIFERPVEPLLSQKNPRLRRSSFEYLQSSSVKRIPSRATIAAFLTIYLLMHVPLTFFVFRGWQRLEYAWIVMPLISISFFAYMFYVALGDLDDTLSITDLTTARLGQGGDAGALTFSMLYNPAYRTYDIEFPNPTATPDHLRLDIAYDNDPLFKGEETHRLSLSEHGNKPRVHDFAIAYNSKRPLLVKSVISLGDGMSARVNLDSFHDVKPAKSLGQIDNKTNVYFPYVALLHGPRGILLDPIVPGEDMTLKVRQGSSSNWQTSGQTLEALESISLREGIYPVLRQAVNAYIGEDSRPHLVLMQRHAPLGWRVEDKNLPSNGLLILFVPCSTE